MVGKKALKGGKSGHLTPTRLGVTPAIVVRLKEGSPPMKIDKVWIDEERETWIPHPPERVLIPSTILGLPDARIYVNGLRRDERPIQLRTGDMIEVRVPPMGTDDVRMRYTARATAVIEIGDPVVKLENIGAPKTHSVLSLTKMELEYLRIAMRNDISHAEEGQDWGAENALFARIDKAIASFGP